MAKATTIKDAIKEFETKKGVVATDESCKKVELYGMYPPIEKMDSTLSNLKSCEHLALSTNNIEKISSLAGMESLKILSLGRNQIKKLENLESVQDTLEELWISYNLITSLAGLGALGNLKVLYLSNNKIAAWNEIDRLSSMTNLEDLLLKGNPLYKEYEDSGTLADYRIEVLKRIPGLKKLDGIPVDVDERDQAMAAKNAA